jgi:hypothetical protein
MSQRRAAPGGPLGNENETAKTQVLKALNVRHRATDASRSLTQLPPTNRFCQRRPPCQRPNGEPKWIGSESPTGRRPAAPRHDPRLAAANDHHR